MREINIFVYQTKICIHRMIYDNPLSETKSKNVRNKKQFHGLSASVYGGTTLPTKSCKGML